MDGQSRWMDDVMLERLWRSLKYESICLRELETGSQAQDELAKWFRFYNWQRPHPTLNGKRLMEIY